MNIGHFCITILFLIDCLTLINPINCSNRNNNTLTMVILATSSSSSVNYYFKRRSARNVISKILNFTNDNSTSSTNQMRTFDISYGYNSFKDVSTLTKTQIKVIITVVIIISFIMLIIGIFRFKNACRHQQTDNLQIETIRNRAAQYSEPSSRRGSVGYYTQKYTRTPGNRFDDQFNIPLPTKRLSIPACDHSSKSTAVVVLLSSPVDTTDALHHHHVTSSCDTSNIPNQQISNASILSSDIKPVTHKANFSFGINQCDDQTPLLTTELSSTIKNSLNQITRKYSLNALLPLVRPSNSHPLCSSLTSTNADGNGIDLKSRRRVSLASAIRRSSFAKQPRTFCSTIDSTTIATTKIVSPAKLPVDSDSSDQPSLSINTSIVSKNPQRKKSSNKTPLRTTSLSSYQKAFMHKIDRFRFIDDSASSTTTVTSPVESIERVNNQQASSHLITNAIEQFDDYVRSKYHTNNTDDDDDDINSLIDRLNSDILTDGSYSDLNILNNTSTTKNVLYPQTFKPVNGKSLQPATSLSGCRKNEFYQSPPINIPHSVTALPISKQRNQVETNGHSRSMDFQSITTKRDLIRPVALISTINETSSSSSTATLTSIRSLTSLEFDDNTKPSGVLVDDDFLPMSSPVDEHFWDMTKFIKNYYELNNTECFPNVGSSPDIEIKRFDPHQSSTLSETSCEEDDDEDNNTSSSNQSEIFSIHEFTIKELQKALVTIKSTSSRQKPSEEILSDQSSSTPSINSTEQFSMNSNLTSTSLDQPTDESLSQKSSISLQAPLCSDFFCDTISSANQPSQIISEEDDTQESSTNDASEGDDSADNGEIDLAQEFELSQKEEQTKTNNLWTINDRDVYIMQEDDILSALVTTTTTAINRSQPTSIMKMTNNKTIDSIEEQPPDQQLSNTFKPKVRFNLDPQYEREREWNKVNKLLGNSVEWTDEFEV